MVKKSLIILFLVCVILTLSTGTMKYRHDVKKNAKTWIKYFKEEDADGLLEWFCDDIKDNYADDTLEEIKAAFEFIDGDIVSYEFESEYTLAQAKDNFKTKFYSCSPVYFIETSTGKKYTIWFEYNYIWKKHPEREGVESIRIVNYEGDNEFSGNEVDVGIVYEQ